MLYTQKTVLCAGTGLAVLLATQLSTPAARAASPTYTLKILGTPSEYGIGNAVNNTGQVTGNYSPAYGKSDAFLSDANGGTLHDLGTLGGTTSDGAGVNDAGMVAGTIFDGLHYNAFLSGANGGPLKNLGTLGGTDSFGTGVNAAGQVVGVSSTASADQHAFLSASNGGALQDLGTQLATRLSALAVNAYGQVTGNVVPYDNGYPFVSASNGGDLHLLGTPGIIGSGFAINDLGQVTGGIGPIGTRDSHAFLSAAGGGALQDLGTLGGTDSNGFGINNSGLVVGSSDLANGNTDAFLYTNGHMLDLNSLLSNDAHGYVLQEALGISNTGFITGDGRTGNGLSYAFLLTPDAPAVPEASSLLSLGLLLTIGLGGVVVSARRRKRAN